MTCNKGLIPIAFLILISDSWGKPRVESLWDFEGRRGVVSKEDYFKMKGPVPLINPDAGVVAEPGGGEAVEPNGADVVEPDGGDVIEPDGGDVVETDGGVVLQPDAEVVANGGAVLSGLDEKVKKVVDSCFCPILVEPVCGSDGVTYPNKFCVKCNTNSTVVIAHQGACNQDDKLRAKYKISKDPFNEDVILPFHCYCPHVEDLVCDADGDTHYNIHCMKCRKPRMTITKKGPCDPDDERYGNR